MKANEFVKKFGWEEASEIVDGIPDKFKFKCLSSTCWDTNIYKYSDRFKPRQSLINMADLKRLVESHAMIEKDFESVEIAEYEYMVSGCYSEPYWIRIKQAIADVESCMEVSSESN